MEIKVQLSESFFAGFFAGILLSLVLGAFLLGATLGKKPGSHVPSGASFAAERGNAPRGDIRPSLPGGPSQGPEKAVIKIVEFSDLHCHHCRQAAPVIKELMNRFRGKIRREFHHFPLSDTPGQGSFLTHEWSACAQEQGRFWEFHDASATLPQIPQAADLSRAASKAGLNLKRLEACVRSGKHQALIRQEKAAGIQKGITGTPTFFINNQRITGPVALEQFSSFIEALIKGAPLPSHTGSAAPAAPSAPALGEAEGSAVLLFDDLHGRPSLGPPDAKITLVEFSDFQCSFCKQFELTLKKLEKNFPGKIWRVWRHYPLPMHETAERIHQASECAFEQGKFWEYHDKLFETQTAGGRDDASLVQLAQNLGLNKESFRQCLESGKYREVVKKDIAKGGQSGVSGTPAVFINGQRVEGAQPYESFEQMIKTKLRES